jgi:hypothetical protein
MNRLKILLLGGVTAFAKIPAIFMIFAPESSSLCHLFALWCSELVPRFVAARRCMLIFLSRLVGKELKGWSVAD